MTADLFTEPPGPPPPPRPGPEPKGPCPSCATREADPSSGQYHADCLTCTAHGFAGGLDVWSTSKGLIEEADFMAAARRIFGPDDLEEGLAIAQKRFEVIKAKRKEVLQGVRERLTAARNDLAGGVGVPKTSEALE